MVKKVYLSEIQQLCLKENVFVSSTRCRELVRKYKKSGKRMTKEDLVEYVREMQSGNGRYVVQIVDDDQIDQDSEFVIKKIKYFTGIELSSVVAKHIVELSVFEKCKDKLEQFVDDVIDKMISRQGQVDLAINIQDILRDQSSYEKVIQTTGDGFYLLFYAGQQNSNQLLSLLKETKECSGLRYVVDQTEQICVEMLKHCKSNDVFASIRVKTSNLCFAALNTGVTNIMQHIPPKLVTREMWILEWTRIVDNSYYEPEIITPKFETIEIFQEIFKRLKNFHRITLRFIFIRWRDVPQKYREQLLQTLQKEWFPCFQFLQKYKNEVSRWEIPNEYLGKG